MRITICSCTNFGHVNSLMWFKHLLLANANQLQCKQGFSDRMPFLNKAQTLLMKAQYSLNCNGYKCGSMQAAVVVRLTSISYESILDYHIKNLVCTSTSLYTDTDKTNYLNLVSCPGLQAFLPQLKGLGTSQATLTLLHICMQG